MAQYRSDKARAGDQMKASVVHHREVPAVVEMEIDIAVPGPDAKANRLRRERIVSPPEESA